VPNAEPKAPGQAKANAKQAAAKVMAKQQGGSGQRAMKLGAAGAVVGGMAKAGGGIAKDSVSNGGVTAIMAGVFVIVALAKIRGQANVDTKHALFGGFIALFVITILYKLNAKLGLGFAVLILIMALQEYGSAAFSGLSGKASENLGETPFPSFGGKPPANSPGDTGTGKQPSTSGNAPKDAAITGGITAAMVKLAKKLGIPVERLAAYRAGLASFALNQPNQIKPTQAQKDEIARNAGLTPEQQKRLDSASGGFSWSDLKFWNW